MNRSMYYRMDGTPYEGADAHMAWAKDFETLDRTIAKTELKHVLVSTVWLGLNHSFVEGPPLIFETMVFKHPSWDSLDCQRYSTLEHAKEGHQEMVEKWLKIEA